MILVLPAYILHDVDFSKAVLIAVAMGFLGLFLLMPLAVVFTEALKDTAFRSAPLSTSEAEEMLADIRAKALLGEFRGLPAVDVPALASILQAVGAIALLVALVPAVCVLWFMTVAMRNERLAVRA